MSLNALPFDSDAMQVVARDLILAGARIGRITGRMGFGGCVRASFPHATPDATGILVMGHLDTVHPIGTELPNRREGNTAWGPGILDMKGGEIDSLAYRGKLKTGLLLALA